MMQIDFSKENIGILGYEDEHKPSTLVFTLPDKLLGVTYINFEFERSDGSKGIIENLTPADGTVTVPLVQSVLERHGTLTMQLVGYVVGECGIDTVLKSPVVKGYVLDAVNAVDPVRSDLSFVEKIQVFISNIKGDVASIKTRISELMAAKHTHSNKSTLDSVTAQTLEDIADNTEARHTHDNKVTIDGFWNELAEITAATPAGQPPIIPDYSGVGRLKWSGSELSLANDGAVIKRVEVMTKDSVKYYRLWLYYGETQIIGEDTPTPEERPAFIDIPVQAVTSASESTGGITVTGSEIEFIVPEQDTADWSENDTTSKSYIANRTHYSEEVDGETVYHRIDANYLPQNIVDNSHTHSNKNLIDGLNSRNFGGVFRLCSGVEPVGNLPLKDGGGSTTTVLYGGVYNKFGNASSPATSITVTGFYDSGNGAQEFILDFFSGETPTTLTLPDTVQWANELTIEKNKHYQISIVDNIALWTAVSTEVTA